LRNHLDQGSGKDGSYREQQARKDAYAHLVSLWPGSSMSTYEISRAYSSRKTLLEKQTKRSEALPGQSQSHSGSNVQDQKASDRAESVAATAASKEDSPQQQHSGYRQAVAEAQDSTGLVFEDASFSASRQQPLEYSSPQTQPQFTSPVPAFSPSRGAHSYHHQQAGFNGIIRSPSAQMDTQHPSPSSLRQSVLAEFSRDRISDQDAQSHLQQPHRNLGFEARSPTQSLDQQVRSRVYSYYTGDIQNHQHQHQQQLQSQPQPQPQLQHQLSHQHQHQQPPQSQSPSAKDEDYASPNSSRYSMSVKNLTSP
ncbi:hypothetical protein IWW45_008883, partial [Coemansia sp. RSA 485]